MENKEYKRANFVRSEGSYEVAASQWEIDPHKDWYRIKVYTPMRTFESAPVKIKDTELAIYQDLHQIFVRHVSFGTGLIEGRENIVCIPQKVVEQSVVTLIPCKNPNPPSVPEVDWKEFQFTYNPKKKKGKKKKNKK